MADDQTLAGFAEANPAAEAPVPLSGGEWYCDQCGARYAGPGLCTNGHGPVAVKRVADNPGPPEQKDAEQADPEASSNHFGEPVATVAPSETTTAGTRIVLPLEVPASPTPDEAPAPSPIAAAPAEPATPEPAPEPDPKPEPQQQGIIRDLAGRLSALADELHRLVSP